MVVTIVMKFYSVTGGMILCNTAQVQ